MSLLLLQYPPPPPFRKTIRVSITNFGDISKEYFLQPLVNYFISNNFYYILVNYYNPHIHFFSVFGDIKKILNSKAKYKIFYTGENTNNNDYINYKYNCVNYVDLSLGFDYQNEDNYMRFPLWLLFFFKPDNTKDEICSILNDFFKKYKKTKFCALIAKHDKNGLRTKMYNYLNQIEQIDCPSLFMHNDDSLHITYNDDKQIYLQRYKFNICPENSESPGYVTEKLFQSLYSGCIPIYNGWNNDPEPEIINPNIILWYDLYDNDKNKELLYHVKKLNTDEKYYNFFISQPFFCDTAVDKIYDYLYNFNFKITNKVKETLKL